MKCENCSYFYANTDSHGDPIERPTCQYHHNDGYAPCEIDEALAEMEPAEIEEFWT